MTKPVALSLRIIAAKAQQLAEDCEGNRLWEGELRAGLQELASQVNRAIQEASYRSNG
jgi:hypothetical protein